MSFKGQASPLPAFSYDTGLQPPASPAQASLQLSANGTVVVSAVGAVQGGQLVPTKGSGAVALDLHFKLAGHLKVTSSLQNYDGDIPGLQNVDIPATGNATFDPFLIGAGTADVSAPIPATQLPDVPLGTIPGKLQIAIGDGSSIKTSYQGSCVSVHGGMASYQGTATTSGTLVLKTTLALSLPAPLDKSIPLPDATVNIPPTSALVDLGTQPAPGASDAQVGTCGTAGDGGVVDGGGGDGGMPASDSASDTTMPPTDSSTDAADAMPEGGACSGAGSSCAIGTGGTNGCCSADCDMSSGQCLAAGTYSATINGASGTDTYVVEQAATSTTSLTLYLYFTAPGLGPNTRLVIGVANVGSGCSPGATGQFVQYQPDDGSFATYGDDGTGSCGLTITSMPPSSVAGSFNGTLTDQATGNSVQASFNFDLPAP